MSESLIKINNHVLEQGHIITLRVALNNFQRDLITSGLGEDEMGIKLKKLYLNMINELFRYMDE